MTDFLPINRLEELPPLDQDLIEDSEFHGKDLAWHAILDLFERRKSHEKLTFEKLGDRIDRPKSQVHRWLSDPTKMTLRALGLLAEGLDARLKITVEPRPLDNPLANHIHPCEAAAKWPQKLTVLSADAGSWALNLATPSKVCVFSTDAAAAVRSPGFQERVEA